MRLVRFNRNVEAPVLARLGSIIGAELVADLRAAYALFLHGRGDPQAREVARLRMPPAIAALLQTGHPGREALAALLPWLSTLAATQPGARGIEDEALFTPLSECRLHAPLRLTKLILAYEREDDEPILVMKPPGAVVGPTRDIVLPHGVGALDVSAGIAMAIGRRCKNASEEEAADAIFGYTAMTDVTARDFAAQGGIGFTAGMFENFAPSGPSLVSKDEIGDPRKLCVERRVNGATRRSFSLSETRWPPARVVAFLSRMGLDPGDMVWIGPLPRGDADSRLELGDTVETEVTGIGLLRNRVVAQS